MEESFAGFDLTLSDEILDRLDARVQSSDMKVATPTLSLWIGCLVVMVIAIGLDHRAGWVVPLTGEWNGLWPRMIMTFAVGALLGLSGALGMEKAPWLSPPVVFVSVIGAAYGFAEGFELQGMVGGVAGLLILGGLGGAVAHLLNREWWFLNIMQGSLITYLILMGIIVLVDARSAQDITLPVVNWLLADINVATTGLAIGIGVVAVVLTIFVALGNRDEWIRWAALAIAVGVVGPIAYITWWAPAVVRGISKDTTGSNTFMVTAALLGATTLVAIDMMQRAAFGGFAPPITLSLAMLGFPCWMLYRTWVARRALPLWHSALEIIVALGLCARVLWGVYQYVVFIQIV